MYCLYSTPQSVLPSQPLVSHSSLLDTHMQAYLSKLKRQSVHSRIHISTQYILIPALSFEHLYVQP